MLVFNLKVIGYMVVWSLHGYLQMAHLVHLFEQYVAYYIEINMANLIHANLSFQAIWGVVLDHINKNKVEIFIFLNTWKIRLN